MTLAVASLQFRPSCTSVRSVPGFQPDDLWPKRSENPRNRNRTSLSKLSFESCSHFQERPHTESQIGTPIDHHPIHQKHQSRVNCVQSCFAKGLRFPEPLWFCGCIHGGCLQMTTCPLRSKREKILFVVNKSDDEFDIEHEGDLEFCAKRSASRKGTIETVDESGGGYVIKVSKELMSVFQYVEKVKRARLKELSETLRQVAYACLFFSCVKGIVTPLVEVFKTQPPSWGKLIMVLGAFDAFAITYLALKASQPLERLSSLATECESESNMMGSIEKEEEYILALAMDLVRLFRRLRNLALGTAVTQFAHILHTMLQLKKSYPNFATHIIKIVNTWLSTPWV